MRESWRCVELVFEVNAWPAVRARYGRVFDPADSGYDHVWCKGKVNVWVYLKRVLLLEYPSIVWMVRKVQMFAKCWLCISACCWSDGMVWVMGGTIASCVSICFVFTSLRLLMSFQNFDGELWKFVFSSTYHHEFVCCSRMSAFISELRVWICMILSLVEGNWRWWFCCWTLCITWAEKVE